MIDGRDTVAILPSIQAPFLVYTSIANWESRLLSNQAITTLDELQEAVEQRALAAGKSLDEPFPFVLKGEAQQITYHVMHRTDVQAEHNPKLHQQANQFFTMDNEPVTLLGFYSRQHQGVFTHHGSFIHVHVFNEDRTKMGHLDNLSMQLQEISFNTSL